MVELFERQPGHWSGTYRGRHIGISDVGGVWLVYIDHTLRETARFNSLGAAQAWAEAVIDQSAAGATHAAGRAASPWSGLPAGSRYRRPLSSGRGHS